jgi:hypothetical protein
VAVDREISCFDIRSGDVRPFAKIANAYAMCLADGLLYAVHGGCLSMSIVHIDSGAIQQSAVQTLHGRSWEQARGGAVLPDFVCVSDSTLKCVHVISGS